MNCDLKAPAIQGYGLLAFVKAYATGTVFTLRTNRSKGHKSETLGVRGSAYEPLNMNIVCLHIISFIILS